MTIFIILFISLLLCYILYGLLKYFELLQKKDDLYVFSFSYILLLGSTSIQLFIYSLLNIHWTTITLLSPWIGIFIYIFIKKKKVFIFNLSQEKTNIVDKFLLFLIISLLLFVGFESILRPVSAWDSLADWLMKAKMFFLDKDIPPMFSYLHSDYPIGISLLTTFFYTLINRIDDTSVLLIFFLFYFFLSILFFSSLKPSIGKTKALFFTFLLLSLQNVMRHGGRFEAGQADLALGYGMLCSALLLVDFFRSPNFKTLFFFEVVISICGFIKYEGIVFSFLAQLFVLYYILRSRRIRYVVCLVPLVISAGGWMAYKHIHEVSAHYIFSGLKIRVERIPYILWRMSWEFLNLKNWNLLWPAFFTTVLIYHKKLRKEVVILLLIVVFQWISYAGVFLVTPVSIQGQIPSTIDRLYLHIAPIALYVIALLIGLNLQNNEIKSVKTIPAFWRKKIKRKK